MFISSKQVLKQAWHIAMANKFLWVFGIFASFVSLENIYEIVLAQISQAQDPGGFYQGLYDLYNRQADYINKGLQALSLSNLDLTGLVAFMIAGAVIIFFIWLALTSQIFIIKSADQFYHDKKVSGKQTFAGSDERFWPILILNCLTKLILAAGLIAFSLPLLYLFVLGQTTFLIYANLAFLLLYVIFSVLVSFLAAYAANFIILNHYRVGHAIRAAWKLFKRNLGISLKMATALFFLKLLSLIVIISIFMLFFMPLSIIFLFSWASGDLLGIVLSLTALILALTLISLLVNSIFTVFSLSAWTLTFIKLKEDTLFGKILNWSAGLPHHIRNFAQEHELELNERKIKMQAAKIAREAESLAKVLGKELKEKYKIYKPIFKKESKKLARQAKIAYIQYQPVFKKESHKMAKEVVAAYQKFEPLIAKKAEKILLEAKKSWPKRQAVSKTPSRTKKIKRVK